MTGIFLLHLLFYLCFKSCCPGTESTPPWRERSHTAKHLKHRWKAPAWPGCKTTCGWISSASHENPSCSLSLKLQGEPNRGSATTRPSLKWFKLRSTVLAFFCYYNFIIWWCIYLVFLMNCSFMKHMENAHVEINLQKHAKAQGMPIVSHTQNKAINTHHLSAKGTKRMEWRDAPFAHVSAKWTNPRNTLHNSSLAWSVETHHMWWQGTAALSISLGTMHDNHFKSPEIPVLRADRVDLELFCRTSPPSPPKKKTVPYAILFQMQRHDQTIHYPKQHHDPPRRYLRYNFETSGGQGPAPTCCKGPWEMIN